MSRALASSLALVLVAAVAPAVEVGTDVGALADADAEGRAAGSPAEERIAGYLEGRLLELGAEPLPGEDELVSTFPLRSADGRAFGRNVVGYLPATPDSAGDAPWIVLSAHYDHLGRGEVPGSLASGEEASALHPGADDNASGVAAVLAAAARLAGRELSRNVILAFWSGSELGGLGARAFLEDPPVAPEEIAAHVNLHMVGRMRDYRLMVQAVGSSPVWPRLVEQVNVPVGFSIQTDPGLREPGDVEPFLDAGIPSVELSTGGHADYHRPTDLPGALDLDSLEEVARFTALLVGKLASLDSAPELAEPEEPNPASGPGTGARPFTGTIPDYAGGGEGLKLSGVVPGGPAEAAGLAAGDVIVELAGVTVTDAYDYMEALEAATIGEPMEVVYLRAGERRETTMTPAARD